MTRRDDQDDDRVYWRGEPLPEAADPPLSRGEMALMLTVLALLIAFAAACALMSTAG